MKILHIASHLDRGGVTTHVLSLARQQRLRGHVVVVAADCGECAAALAAEGIMHWPVPLHTSSILSPSLGRAVRNLTARMAQQPVDIIHAHTRVAQVVAQRLSRKSGIAYVATWHGFFRPNPGRRLWPCTGGRTIAVSEPVRRHLLECFHVPPERVRLVPNGVDADYFSQQPPAQMLAAYRGGLRLASPHPLIGSVGRLASGRVKGFDLVLGAAKVLRDSFSGLSVLIAGEGPLRPWLVAEAARLGLADCVRLPGSAADVRLPLSLMDVFIFSSRQQEGFGLALIEAMAAGKPVVAVRTEVSSAIVEDGKSGILVEPESPQAIAAAVGRLLGASGLAQALAAGAQQRVRSHFSLSRMAEGVEAVYRELLP